MKVTCKFSGVTYEVQNFGNTYLQGQHPLMQDTVKLEQLIELYKTWNNGLLSPIESRILFVALMKFTDLFEFRVPASPKEDIVEFNMEPLIRRANFIASVNNPTSIFDKRIFPSVAIDALSKSCNNMNNWLQTFQEREDSWKDNYRIEGQRKRLEDSEEALMKLIRSPYTDPARKMTHLAKWTMVACNIHKDDWEDYMPIFKLKGIDIYTFKLPRPNESKEAFNARGPDTWTIDKLLLIMEDELAKQWSYNSPILANEALKHIRYIHFAHHKGLGHAIGDEELEYIDFAELRRTPYKLIEDDTGEKNLLSVALMAQPAEPKMEQFTDRLSYFKAKAAWMAAMEVIRKMHMEQQSMRHWELHQKNKLQQTELDSSHIAEEPVEDPNQLGLDLNLPKSSKDEEDI